LFSRPRETQSHIKRRDLVKHEQQIETWIAAIKDLIAEYPAVHALRLIVNVDDTAWRTFPRGLLTSASVGAGGMTLRLDENENEKE
jgi:hypothetical protein